MTCLLNRRTTWCVSLLAFFAIAVSPISADEGLVQLVKTGCSLTYSGIKSGRGSVRVTVSKIAGGSESNSESKITVAFRGDRLRVSSDTIRGPRAAYEGSFDGVNTVEWIKDSKLPATVRAGASGMIKGEFDLFADPRAHGMADLDKASDLKFLSKEILDGDECLCVESVTPAVTVDGKDVRSRLKFWVSTAQGFTIPKFQVWSVSGADETLVREETTKVRSYGEKLWGPAAVSRIDYNPDGTVKKRVSVVYGPEFQLNVPVGDDKLEAKLPPGTKVVDTVNDMEYVIPRIGQAL